MITEETKKALRGRVEAVGYYVRGVRESRTGLVALRVFVAGLRSRDARVPEQAHVLVWLPGNPDVVSVYAREVRAGEKTGREVLIGRIALPPIG